MKNNHAPVFGFCLSLMVVFGVPPGHADSIETNVAGYAWSENAGWISLADPLGYPELVFKGSTNYWRGFWWSENAGWISLSAQPEGPHLNSTGHDYGVNMDGYGRLSGLAWSESCGWINFNVEPGVIVDLYTGRWSGFAWSEGVGWIAFDHDFAGQQPRVVWNKTAQGVPDWWFVREVDGDRADVESMAVEDADGDGSLNWQEYFTRTGPRDPASALFLSAEPAGNSYIFSWDGQSGLTYLLLAGSGSNAMFDLAWYRIATTNQTRLSVLTTNLPDNSSWWRLQIEVDSPVDP